MQLVMITANYVHFMLWLRCQLLRSDFSHLRCGSGDLNNNMQQDAAQHGDWRSFLLSDRGPTRDGQCVLPDF